MLAVYVLSAKAEFLEQIAVASNVTIAHIIEHATATTHQHQKATTTVVVFGMRLEVSG
jgi:hypothetical protein